MILNTDTIQEMMVKEFGIRIKSNYKGNIKFIISNLIIIITIFVLYELNNYIFIRYSNGHIYYFCTCYFDDLMAGTLMMSSINIVLVLLFSKRIKNLFPILLMMLLIGIFWEYSPNIFRENAVSDIADIVAYEIGGLFYWFLFYIKEDGYV